MKINSVNLNTTSKEIILNISKLDHDNFPFPWDESKWLSAAKNNYYHVFYDEEFKAFALFQIDPVEKFAHLLKIVVDFDARKMGLGSKLLKFCLDCLVKDGFSRVFLEVDTVNDAACSLYSSFDFKTIHKKNKFYSNGHDAYIMEKQLIKLPNN
jgi:ribosomal-protein-alanine N-acetyltransferase